MIPLLAASSCAWLPAAPASIVEWKTLCRCLILISEHSTSSCLWLWVMLCGDQFDDDVEGEEGGNDMSRTGNQNTACCGRFAMAHMEFKMTQKGKQNVRRTTSCCVSLLCLISPPCLSLSLSLSLTHVHSPPCHLTRTATFTPVFCFSVSSVFSFFFLLLLLCCGDEDLAIGRPLCRG